MKVIILFAIIFSLSFTDNLSFREVVNALNNGNANKLSNFFDTNVELDFGNKNVVFSNRQAEQVLRDFFKSNMVKNFVVLHFSSPVNNSKYCYGTLNTVNGIYHTSLFFKVEGKEELIQVIRFVK